MKSRSILEKNVKNTNDLDKQNILEFVQEIKSIINNIGSVSTNNPLVIEDINDIIYCANAIVEIIESPVHKIERIL